MSESGNTWPPPDPRLPQDPRGPGGFQPPRPLHHDPRDYDPRLGDPRRAEDSPWRRTQRLSRPQDPQTTGWQPAAASHASGLGGQEFYPREPEPYDEDDYDDQYNTGGRFVPGFGDYGDEDEEDDQSHRGRTARRPPDRPRGPKGPRGPRRRRYRWLAPLVALLNAAAVDSWVELYPSPGPLPG